MAAVDQVFAAIRACVEREGEGFLSCLLAEKEQPSALEVQQSSVTAGEHRRSVRWTRPSSRLSPSHSICPASPRLGNGQRRASAAARSTARPRMRSRADITARELAPPAPVALRNGGVACSSRARAYSVGPLLEVLQGRECDFYIRGK